MLPTGIGLKFKQQSPWGDEIGQDSVRRGLAPKGVTDHSAAPSPFPARLADA
jgi:hypothetical protein